MRLSKTNFPIAQLAIIEHSEIFALFSLPTFPFRKIVPSLIHRNRIKKGLIFHESIFLYFGLGWLLV